VSPPSAYPPEFLAHLIEIVGEGGVRHGDQLRTIDPGVHPDNLQAGLMARPAKTSEVAGVLALCNAARVGVVPQGGRTGLAGGAVTRPGQLIVSLERMSRIETVNPGARTATVEAGVTLERLEEALAPHGLVAGIDLGARSSATIGGMVSTNAGGIEAFRYGTMRDRVLGLEVALASGVVLEELTRVRKDNAGLPLRQLFIGSEGTLGIVTRAVLALAPQAGPRTMILVLVPDLEAAISVMRAVEARPEIVLTAAELMSGNHLALTARSLGITQVASASPAAFGLLLAAAGGSGGSAAEALEEALIATSEAGLISDALVPKSAAEERDLWRIREDWAVDRVRPGGLWYDVSVPIDALADYFSALEARIGRHDAELEVYVVGHLADGNIHVTINAARPITERYSEIAPLIYEGLRAGGGSFSAEHGIGLEKRTSLESWVGPTGIALMQAVKAVFDPLGIMNPGKVLRATGAEADWPDETRPQQAGH